MDGQDLNRVLDLTLGSDLLGQTPSLFIVFPVSEDLVQTWYFRDYEVFYKDVGFTNGFVEVPFCDLYTLKTSFYFPSRHQRSQNRLQVGVAGDPPSSSYVYPRLWSSLLVKRKVEESNGTRQIRVT